MSNKPSYDHYIISESEDVSILIRLRDLLLTAALWIIYFYFIRDAFPFVADLARWAFHGFDDVDQYPDLRIVPTIETYGQVLGAMVALYLGWAIYNMLRFRGRNRRKPRTNVTSEDLANMYGFSVETVESWQDASSLVMHHDDHGHLTDVKIVK
jgi:biofilm PGA synthesis protein PgaD